MIVLVTGWRHWDDDGAIRQALDRIHTEEPVTLVEGGATGADRLCRIEARRRGWTVHTEPADWSRGKRAGPERNQRMIDQFPPDVALVFLHPESRGTRDCWDRLKKTGCMIHVIHYGAGS